MALIKRPTADKKRIMGALTVFGGTMSKSTPTSAAKEATMNPMNFMYLIIAPYLTLTESYYTLPATHSDTLAILSYEDGVYFMHSDY